MLSLTIAMFREIFALTLVVYLGVPGLSVLAQGDTPTSTPTNTAQTQPATVTEITPISETEAVPVTIQSPSPGGAIQGVVTIFGTIPAENFQNGELTFAYSQNPTSTWFLIEAIDEPREGGLIAEWDTTTITDGTYDLRLSIFYENTEEVIVEVPGLRVRNYTPIETNTPTPVTPTVTPVPGSSPTPTETPIPPTATSFPGNPAQITTQDVVNGFGNGVLVTLGIFSLIGLYVMVRNQIANR